MGIAAWFKNKTFSHGIHPEYHKDVTSQEKIRRLAFAPRMIIPLDQHIGKPAIPIVEVGQEVVRGQPIARADGWMSSPLHAPATGIVKAIDLTTTVKGPKSRAIVLEVYEGSTQRVLYSMPMALHAYSPREIVQAVQDSGLVGLGGAAFPSHVKMVPPEGYQIETLVVNGCECEPYLTTDHRVMLEQTADLIRGTQYAMTAAGAKRAIIGVEDNKLDAVEAIRKALPADGSISVEAVETKYPQGSEKMLIKSLLGLEVPAGGLPAHIGVMVNNVGTLAQMGRLLPRGEGLIERVVTITGPGVKKPGNYLIPIGTPLGFVLKQVGFKGNSIILGGPMMGNAVASPDVPITKGVSGILLFDDEKSTHGSERRYHCISCGKCVNACPMHLNPAEMGLLASKREYEKMADNYHLNSCFECGCCSFVCPAEIPLVQHFRVAKALNRQKQLQQQLQQQTAA